MTLPWKYGHVLIRQRDEIPQAVWNNICADLVTLIDRKPMASGSADGRYNNRRIVLCDILGTTGMPPTITGDYIIFNGEISNVCNIGEDHMWVQRTADVGTTDICHTNHKPYDLFVCLTILLLHHHTPGTFEFASDGSWEEWDCALQFIQQQLGYCVTPDWL